MELPQITDIFDIIFVSLVFISALLATFIPFLYGRPGGKLHRYPFLRFCTAVLFGAVGLIYGLYYSSGVAPLWVVTVVIFAGSIAVLVGNLINLIIIWRRRKGSRPQ